MHPLMLLLLFAAPRRPSGVGFWPSRAYYAVFNGRAWEGPRYLTASAASDWHLDALEAHGGHQPLANIQLHRWNGSSWKRAA